MGRITIGKITQKRKKDKRKKNSMRLTRKNLCCILFSESIKTNNIEDSILLRRLEEETTDLVKRKRIKEKRRYYEL